MSLRKKGGPYEVPIFQCLAMFTEALGPLLSRAMHDLFDSMFVLGLSGALYNALRVIADHIPPLLPEIQGSWSKQKNLRSQ